MKRSGVQFDDRIVECVWDPHGGPAVEDGEGEEDGNNSVDEGTRRARRPPAWRIHRIRDDKRDGNHTSIVKKIILSILDGVEEHEVVSVAPDIRAAWKSEPRESLRKAYESGATGASNHNVRSLSGTAGDAAAANTDSATLARGASTSTGGGRPPPMPIGPPGVIRI